VSADQRQYGGLGGLFRVRTGFRSADIDLVARCCGATMLGIRPFHGGESVVRGAQSAVESHRT